MKPFKTLDEQIEILKNRNLKFKNKEDAKKYLLKYNYYNIVNCYSKFFMNNNGNYEKDTHFEDILEVHHFDKEIKNTILKYILEVERHFKSILAYNYAKFYKDNSEMYLNVSSYNENYKLKAIDIMLSIYKEIDKRSRHKTNNSIKHYYTKYKTVPIWVLIDYLTFGKVINFYKIIPEKIRNNVVKDLLIFLEDNLEKKLKIEIPPKNIDLVLDNILELRNITAHNNILLGYKFRNDLPFLPALHNIENINKNDNRQNINNTVLYLQLFLSKNQYNQFKKTIIKRIKKLKKKVSERIFKKIIYSFGLSEDW